MIIADSFLWLHLPKTGGTSMNRLFRSLALPAVEIDDDADRAKHDSVALRESRGSLASGRSTPVHQLTASLQLAVERLASQATAHGPAGSAA